MHATMAGIISGAHYAWGVSDRDVVSYAVRAVSDDDGDVPDGALSSLDLVPTSDQSGNHEREDIEGERQPTRR